MIPDKKVAAAVILLLLVLSATAANASALDGWLSQKTATGNWGGLRDSLERSGISVSSNYTTDTGGNPSGGLKQTTDYSGFVSLAAVLDFEKIASIQGLSLKVSNFLASGRDITVPIGSFYSPQQVFTSGDYYFGELKLSKSVLDDTFNLEAGRIFAGDILAVSPMFKYYLTSAVDGRLGAIPSDIFFPHYRTAAWGTRATFQPNKDWSVITGLYDADPSVAEPNKNGADFSLRTDKGYLTVGQITYRHGQEREGLITPGGISFGSYYESSSFTYLSNPDIRNHGNYGFYLVADKMIYKGEWPEYEGPSHLRSGAKMSESLKKPHDPQMTALPLDRPKGLTVWGAGMLAPQDDINPQTYQIATGLVYQGLPPNRNRDVTAFCFILGHFSDKLEGQTDEMILELDHRFQLGPWCYVTPDIQYIINPDGKSDVDNALVLGFEASFDF
ncbi:MAG: carbohydrate porin [Candidatus Omnitrophica bacterium]|nr:carbohydrate porin [Candidatus Omnitrophota bacterium]MDD5547007.1 carbohydrate porin [Candidatus Omnitrophota bacterium]